MCLKFIEVGACAIAGVVGFAVIFGEGVYFLFLFFGFWMLGYPMLCCV
jgi:predicted exporter